MMLKPFRIRHLDSQRHGIVQINTRQYDATIVSQPDAALTYLDDDDGEIITVGSSFELAQRLNEPALDGPVSPTSPRFDPTIPMHIFDIKHTAASLAIWREHEAYSSKTLRENSTSSKSVSTTTSPAAKRDLGMWTIDENGRTRYDRFAERDPENYLARYEASNRDPLPIQHYTMREDGPRSPVLNIETASIVSTDLQARSISQDAFQYGTCESEITKKSADTEDRTSGSSAYVRLESTQTASQLTCDTSFTNEDDSRASKAVKIAPLEEEVKAIGLEQIVTGALQGLDKHLGGFADFLQSTSKALRDAADKTVELDTSAVEGVLDGFRGILGEVGKIGRTMLETLDTEATAIARDIAPIYSKTFSKRDSADMKSAENPTALPNPTEAVQNPKSVPSQFSTEVLTTTPLKSDMQANENITCESLLANPLRQKLALATLPGTIVVPPVYAALNRSNLAPNYSVLRDCPAPRHVPTQTGYVRGDNLKLPIREMESMVFPEAKHVIVEAEDQPLAAQKMNQTDATEIPAQTPASISKSILDLETSDPDFSVRYPPLMTLRRARTVAGLNSYTLQGPKAASTTQTALSRYPSIDQLEKKRQQIRDPVHHGWSKHPRDSADNKAKQASIEDFNDIDLPQKTRSTMEFDVSKPVLVEEESQSQVEKKRKTSERPETLIVEPVEPGVSIAHRLPGAWPEVASEHQSSESPVRNESSGAFFDRMTRSRGSHASNPALNTQADIRPLHAKPSMGLRHGQPPRDANSRSGPFSDLRRAQTVAALNPAARLTRPFDPLVAGLAPLPSARPGMSLFPREGNDTLKRSGTERQHRRRQQWGERFAAVHRQPFDPFAPEHLNEDIPQHQTNAPAYGPRPMRSVPQFSSVSGPGGFGSPSPPRATSFPARSKVDDCLAQLTSMGYGSEDPHEASRLNVYAAAAAGDLSEAMDMIEEDRKGSWEAWQTKKKGQKWSGDF